MNAQAGPFAAGWAALFRRRRFQVLFGLLLTTLLVAPLARAAGFGGGFLEACLIASLLSAGLGGLGVGRGAGIVLFAVLFGASRAIHGILGGDAIDAASDLFLELAAVLAGIAALREVLREGAVTGERLYAAISVYLLAGLAFAVAYQALSRMVPGAFAIASAPGTAPLDTETAVYFSFVTLATLGYGDVVPVTPFARSLAICEAVGAQLFVAVLIARLVSLQARPPE